MKEIYFIDYSGFIYDKNENNIGRIGSGYIVDRTRSDLIHQGKEIGKFVNIANKDEIKKYIETLKAKSVDELVGGKLNTVTKEENGMIKNYIVTEDGKIFDDNNSNLNFNDKIQITLMEWLEDPLKSEQVSSMSPEKLRDTLVDAVSLNYKEYYFDDPNKTSDDEKGRLAGQRAYEVDGKVNSELGIIENGAQDVNEFSTVEERGNGYEVVIPTVTASTINSSSTTTSSSDVINSASEQTEEEIQQREVSDNVFYLDDSGNVYSSDGEIVNGVDPKLVWTDKENNLWYENEKVGVYGGTLDDLAQEIENNKKKGNIRVRKKEDAGFGSIEIIMILIIVLNTIAAFIGLLLYK